MWCFSLYLTLRAEVIMRVGLFTVKKTYKSLSSQTDLEGVATQRKLDRTFKFFLTWTKKAWQGVAVWTNHLTAVDWQQFKGLFPFSKCAYHIQGKPASLIISTPCGLRSPELQRRLCYQNWTQQRTQCCSLIRKSLHHLRYERWITFGLFLKG